MAIGPPSLTTPASGPAGDADGERPAPSRRRHPLVLGTVAAFAALVAAVAAGGILASLSPARPAPTPEMELRFSPGEQDPAAGLAGDAVGDGLPAESFAMLDGGLGSFADYRGRPLVINLFASNCAPCIEEMPAFEAVHRELGEEVAFLGLNIQDQVGAATALVEQTGVTYDIARDPSGELARRLGMVVMPSTYFVSAAGSVVDAKAGAMDAEELRRRIEALRA